jgi:uncharacterized membrane protein YesL
MDSKAEQATPPREALNDEDLLAQLGYKQEFKRDFSQLELFGLSFSIVGVVQSIAAVLLFSLPYGGLVGMVCRADSAPLARFLTRWCLQ